MHALLNEAKYRTLTQARYLFNKRVKGRRVEQPPIFIAGPGHSGTSLLLAILGAHSNLFAIPQESNVAYASGSAQRKLVRRFCKMAVAHGKSRWVEKTPRHIKKIDELLALFPDARIVITMRDGRDVACSYKVRRGSGIEEHVEHWVAAVEQAERYRDHPQVRVLRYEDLILDFEGTMKGLMVFLGEAYEPGQAEYHKKPIAFYWHNAKKPAYSHSGNHEQHRNWQVNQPLFDGRGRWKKEMEPAEKEVFKREAGTLLVDLGYAADDDW